ncbi:hypothetical protein MNBD_IGNAVI01-2729 [hydrothermal vent metagenome]|uniref:Uncharacterized protein n=1 Tax=hydrothermal vent metagenome TaxID=652676 RepID=A0A3B1CYN8_9ZZZZ
MSKTIIRIIFLTVFLIVAGFFISGPIFTNSEIKDKIGQLRDEGANTEIKIDFKTKEFLALPPIVQKYLKNSIVTKSENNKIATVKLSGETKPEASSEWKKTDVDFYYSLSTPAFIWVATSEEMTYLWNKTINTLFNNSANSKNKLLSSITTDEIEGVKLSQTYFLYYILNSVLCPVVLLPSQNIQWTSLGKLKAEVMFWNKSESGTATFYFNNSGNVEKVEAKDMFMPNLIEAKKGKFSLHLANYKEIGGYRVPTYLEYQWNLSDGDFSFARFNVKDITYN